MSNRTIILFSAILIFSAATNAQIPDKFTNLTVFPQDIGKEKLTDVMKKFSSSLGVRCGYCHDKKESVEKIESLADFDFASDKIPAKDITRVMMKMTSTVNNEFLNQISEKSNPVKINCETCHKGMPAPPEKLDMLLFNTIMEQGADAGINKYKELYNKYYGDYVYNFSFKSVARLSKSLRQAEKYDDSIKFLEYYKKYNSDIWRVYFEIGKAYHEKKDFNSAEKYYNMSLELNEGNEDVLWFYNKLKEETN